MKTKSALPAGRLCEARILVVDDEIVNVRLLQTALAAAGYTNVTGTCDPTEVPQLLTTLDPDIVLLDLHMPRLDGYGVLDLLRALVPPGVYLPVLVLTADDSLAAKERALDAGAMDFVGKPFKVTEILLRIRNLLHTRMMHLELRERNERLDELVVKRTHELEQARIDILQRLAATADYHDDATGRHTRRVGRGVGMLAAEMGMPAEEAGSAGLAAMLHDVGKIGVPDKILLKPGKLTKPELKVMRTHTTIGQRLLAGSPARMMQIAEQIALTHHEWWDGRGYHGLAGEDIPLVGRLTCVVDVFDALTHDRPYRPALPISEVLVYLRAGRGAQFDPCVLDAFVELLDRIGPEQLFQEKPGVRPSRNGAAPKRRQLSRPPASRARSAASSARANER
jgi:putative two-component system response regulator